MLDRQIVLRRILRAHVWLEFTEQQDRFKQRPVKGGAWLRIENTIGPVRQHSTALIHVRSVEQRAERGQTDAERRLRAELLKHELFNRIVKQTPASANTGFAITARIPRQTKARRKSF